MSDVEIRLVKPAASTCTNVRIRTHEVVVDRPADKGGTDAGPMGGEYLLAAVGGCFMSTTAGSTCS